jgi:hypothetical protein
MPNFESFAAENTYLYFLILIDLEKLEEDYRPDFDIIYLILLLYEYVRRKFQNILEFQHLSLNNTKNINQL